MENNEDDEEIEEFTYAVVGGGIAGVSCVEQVTFLFLLFEF